MKLIRLISCTVLISTLSLTQKISIAAPDVSAATSNHFFLANNTTPTEIEEDFSDDEDEIIVSDPFESINRKIFSFNDTAYVYILKPIARGFRAVIPEKGRVAVNNFFSNLLSPVRIANAAMQLKGEDATNEIVRLIVNSTLGLGGLFDIAKNDFKIKIKKEDFGQTLGHYKVANGPYIVIPFLGPSTIRDGVGLLVDGTAFDPVSYIYDDETGRYILVKLIDIENTISLDQDTYEAIKKDSLDPYLFLRNSYIQHRAGVVEN